jgi:hypothetical protein
MLEMARDAGLHQRNRQVDVGLLEAQIDPDGIHILSTAFVHNHVAGKAAEPHYRTEWLVKLKGQQSPENIWIDVSVDVFRRSTNKVRKTTVYELSDGTVLKAGG